MQWKYYPAGFLVHEQKRIRAISVGERPSAASSTVCILNLRLGFAFALHLLDEILAFFRSDGDTLHGRPSLWCLDGFGVFTMQQEEMAVCSIILCIYLVHIQNRCRVRRYSGSHETLGGCHKAGASSGEGGEKG